MTSRILSTTHGVNREAFAPPDWGLLLGLAGIWGSSFLFMAVGLDAFHPGLVTLLRVGLGAGTLAFVPAALRPIARADWPRLVVVAFLWLGLPLTLFPIAQQWIDSAVAGMLNGSMPIFTALVASVLLGELPGLRQRWGLVIGFAGVVAVILPSVGKGTTAAIGVVLVVVATVCYAFAVNIVAPLQQRYGSLPVLARALWLATAMVAPYGLIGLPASSFAWPSTLAMLALGILGTGLGFVMMGTLVGRVGSTRASFISYLLPVVALALGVVFRNEQVAALALAGAVLVVVGAMLASRRER